MVNMHAPFLIDLVFIALGKEVILEFLDVDIHNPALCQVESHIIQIAPKVDILNLIVTVLHHVVTQQKVDFLDIKIACIVQDFAHLVKCDLA
jgi:hypothetical protein